MDNLSCLQIAHKTLHAYNTALQLVEYPHGDGMEVVFAGGRRKLMHKNQTDPEYPDKRGERLDGRDLIQEWVGRHPNSKYVWNKTEFDQIDGEKVDHVIGTYNYEVGNIVILKVLAFL